MFLLFPHPFLLLTRHAPFSGLVVFLLLLPPLFNASRTTTGSSVLHLDVNFNVSFAALAEAVPNVSLGAPSEGSSKELVGILGRQPERFLIDSVPEICDLFFPILSSSEFNITSAPVSGYSFGFYLLLETGSMYLAVCGGFSGNWSDTSSGGFFLQSHSRYNSDFTYFLRTTKGGYAVPLWVANANRPLPFDSASLVVVAADPASHGINVLQLRDGSGTVVWSVEDVGLMEMQDTGNLVIYDSINKSKVVWQSLSQSRDTLSQNQKLAVGMQLVSKDAAYTARMEEGGLVVYLNKPQFIEHPSAFWIIPSFSSTRSQRPGRQFLISKADLQRRILKSQCVGPHEPGYVVLNDTIYSVSDVSTNSSSSDSSTPVSTNSSSSDSSTPAGLKSEQCAHWSDINVLAFVSAVTNGIVFFTYCFLKLEINGQLYMYAVDTTTSPLSFYKYPVDQGSNNAIAGACAAPMACGPLGICTPNAASLCACPHASPEGMDLFRAINATDNSKGCTLVAPLPQCVRGDEHVHTTDYLRLNETSSTFLFGGWPFAFTPSVRAEHCMRLCSSNCSCIGFFYQVTQSACFFMTDGISLLHTSNQNNSFISDIDFPNGTALASSFVTYLKINRVHKTKHLTIIMVASSVVACLLMLGLALYVFHAKKEKRRSRAWRRAKQEEEEELRDILPLLPRRFSYEDLQKATDGFSKLLGAGGCGSVYGGVLSDGCKVAVKMLEASMLKGQQSKQFLAEVATVGRTNHHNIVGLVGFCWEVYCPRLLVYEYMEKGSLDQWLFVREGKSTPSPVLNWQMRHNVALGIAQGLTYLHEECPQPILHFDIKPQNILLDDAFVAKLADFGLSRRMQRDISEVITGVRGTPGYIAPEWLAHGAVSKKSDIYSMGMVMLEIVGGRRNIDISLLNTASEEWHFPSWAAKQCEQGLMFELVDKRIAHAYDKEQACRLILSAFWCIHESASKRPSASTVVQWLEGSGCIKVPPFSAIAQLTQSSSEVTSS